MSVMVLTVLHCSMAKRQLSRFWLKSMSSRAQQLLQELFSDASVHELKQSKKIQGRATMTAVSGSAWKARLSGYMMNPLQVCFPHTARHRRLEHRIGMNERRVPGRRRSEL
ncbi:hypothetical protein CVIRNUC_000019 [Coccomyxa viridis]|uniref:Secreted protein n=1 Tax=Coccomyxa viridis TaxID=1274662 RepID=A0AAV1HPE2_9CHLO|nr:hypothetical protein CVIRNUC_000019 [Coccomyxa viridis]